MENVSPTNENQPAQIDFSSVPDQELRPLAQQLIDDGDVANLKKLREYAEQQKDALPHNTLYASDWSYWNFSYLLGEINTALQTTFAAEDLTESSE